MTEQLIKPEQKHVASLASFEPVSAGAQAAESLHTLAESPPLGDCQKTLIVIPAFNEGKNIGGVLDKIKEFAAGIPVLVINDGSIDNTGRVAGERGADVITLPYNSGYGVALQTGFIYAVKHGYSIVIQMDADGQHEPGCIKDLLQEIQKDNVDVVIGSRFLGKNKYQTSVARHTGMFIFGKLASWFCAQKVSDPTSGFQALKGKAISFAAGNDYPPDYPDADFLITLHRSGFSIREIPVTMRPSPKNKSMHKGHRTVYYVFKMFLSIVVTLLRQKSPR